MADVTINYKGAAIATMDASGTKSLLTEGKYCEDDFDVVYVKPSGSGGLPETLLGSGTFTVTEVSSQFIFPVTYTGTPDELLAIKDSDDVGIGETSAWINITPDLPTAAAAFPKGVRLERIKNANDTYNYSATFNQDATVTHLCDSNGAYNATGSYMAIRQFGNSNKIQPGGYHWYIYGSAS